MLIKNQVRLYNNEKFKDIWWKMEIRILSLALLLISLTGCISSGTMQSHNVSIGEIQGCDHTSPFNGRMVQNVQGVVTHKFGNGFTMQSITSDQQQCSSDAIFVTTGEYPKVMPGQLVSVDGLVEEYTPGSAEDHNLSKTEIHQPAITVLNEKVAFPEPLIIGEDVKNIPEKRIKSSSNFDPISNGLDYYESLEFMLVEVNDGIVVGPKNEYNEFIVLPRKFIQANVVSQQDALLSSEDDENPEKIMVDAASSFSQDVNVGDELSGPVIGIMDYSYGNYKIWTITDPLIFSRKIADQEFDSTENSLTVATYNLENFSRFDDSSRVRRIGCQIVRDLNSPDILVLNEVLDDIGIQDDGVVSAQKTLELLSKSIMDCGGPNYAYSDNPPENNKDGGIAGGNIRTCVLYRQDKNIILETPINKINSLMVTSNGIVIGKNPLRLFSNDQSFLGTRKPTIWLFDWKGEQFIILGLHLVSQSANTPDWGNLHPIGKPEQMKREDQMKLIYEYLSKQNLLISQANVIIIGDFNDYPWSTTIDILNNKQDVEILKNPIASENYSYIHEGNAFQFDYIAVNQTLKNRINQYVIPHINTLLNSKDQVSDHDPVFVEISSLN